MNQQKQNNNANWFFDIVCLLALFVIFYAAWIGSYPLFTPDEGRYSEVAREMVVSGDYITPRLNGVAFLDKPVLYYWLQAAAINMFGLKEWALRFWPAFMGVLGSLVAYVAGRLLFDRRAGILSAIILATSPLFYGSAHYANMDLEVAALIGNSLLCFLVAMEGAVSQRIKRISLLTAYVFAGLAALTKGLIGIVFPAMIIGAWILILNRWNIIKNMRLFTGMCIFLLITLPWYVLVQKANPEFLHFFFVTQQVSRFLTTQDFNSKAAVWFYLPVVLVGFFPWSIFLIQAIGQKLKLVWQDRQQHAVNLFLLLWLFLVFIFFSIPQSKTVGYIITIFPAMALLVGSYLSNLWNAPTAKGVFIGAILYTIASFFVAAVFLAIPHFNQIFQVPLGFMPYLRYMAITLVLAGIVASVLARKAKNLLPLFSCMTAMIVVLLLIFISSASAVNDKSVKPVVAMLKPSLQPGDEVIAFYKYFQDLPIYLERRITIVADWHAADIPHRDNWLREMWYGMVFQDTKDWLIEEEAFWKRWNSDKRLYVFTNDSYYDYLKTKATVYIINQQGDIYLVSNKPG